MKQILTIAYLTLYEAYKKKFWLVSVAFLCVLLFCISAIPTTTDENKVALLTNWSLSSIYAFTMIIIIIFGGLTIPEDIETKRTFMLFSKPMGRVTYITGRFFGFAFLASIIILFLGLIAFITVSLFNLFAGTDSKIFNPREIVPYEKFTVGQNLTEGGKIGGAVSKNKTEFSLTGGLQNAAIWYFSNLNPDDFPDEVELNLKLVVKEGGYAFSGNVYLQIMPLLPDDYSGVRPPIYFQKIPIFSNKTATIKFPKEIISATTAKEISTGTLDVRITRLHETTEIIVTPESVTLYKKGGSFFGNLIKNLCVIFFNVFTLTSFVLLGSVVLSGPFSIFFGTFILFISNIISYIKDGMSSFKVVIDMKERAELLSHHSVHEVGVEDPPLWVLKFFYFLANGVISVFPDSSKMKIETKLTSGVNASWTEIIQIFYYTLPFILVAFVVASFACIKREYK